MSLEYAQYVMASILSRTMPPAWSYGLAVAIANRSHRTDTKGRLAVIANLRRIYTFLGKPQDDATLERLSLQTFRNFAMYLADFFRFTRPTAEMVNRLVTIDRRPYLDQALAANSGTLLMTAHLGNWEIGGAVIATMGRPLNVVVMPQQDRRTNDLFQSHREMRGFKVIPLGNAAQGILQALERKELVALLADRDYAPRGITMDFFGAPARLPAGPAKLCIRTQTPIFPGFLFRNADNKFTLRCYESIVPSPRSTVAEIQEKLCRVLEDAISQDPTQWFIFDDFWKNGHANSRTATEST